MFPDSFGHHLAGLLDGEGHFGIMRQKKSTGSVNYSCLLAMDMRDDDTAVIEMLHERTGWGISYKSGPRNQGPQRLDAKPVAMWRVHKKTHCLEIVHFLERYPLWTKKARDYHIWAKAVRYLNAGRPEGWAPMERWFYEIRAIRQYVPTISVEETYAFDTLTLFDQSGEE